MFSETDLASLPEPLLEKTLEGLAQWQLAIEPSVELSTLGSGQIQQCIKTFAGSRFVSRQFIATPSLGVELLSSGE